MQRTGVRSWTLVVAGSLLIGSVLTGCGGASSGSSSTSAQGSANGSVTTAAADPGAADSSGTSTQTSASTTATTPDTGSQPSTGATQTGVAQGTAGTVTLNWQPPTQNSDGSPITGLAGYNIYYGTASQSYSQSIKLTNPGLTTYVVENLPAGTYYFSIAAYDATGAQSSFSPEVAAAVTD